MRALLILACLGLIACAPPDEEDYGDGLALDGPAVDDPGAILAFGKADDERHTACARVAHIGDSLSAGVIPALQKEYEALGVTSPIVSAKGGRGILQKVRPDPETGEQAAQRIRAEGFDGCWVIALGTNDAGNIAAGASYTQKRAIDRMMKAIDEDGRAQVMWVNVVTTRTTGYYANANMVAWNEALESATFRWPNLHVYDWATRAGQLRARDWADGIHYNGTGYTVRNRAIADALAATFPR